MDQQKQAANFQEQISRLREEQGYALQDTDDQIKKWLGFKSDYEALKQRLTTLPDQMSHDVMVPFGKMAFMPGRLVHTNEILVLLGDNWFADRSAKQAVGIVNRRIKQIDKQLDDLHKQRKLLEPRLDFTSDLQQLGSDGNDTFDIREEYDEEKEKLWKQQHRERVKKHRQKMKDNPQQNTTSSSGQSTSKHDDDLWARLDELELIESEGREMEKMGDEDTQESTQYPWKSDQYSENKQVQDLDQAVKHRDKVYSADTGQNEGQNQPGDNDEEEDSELSETSEELDSDDEASASETGESESDDIGDVVTGGKVIHFTHTSCKDNESAVPSEVHSDIIHPGDVYSKFIANRQPKSILKKSPAEPKKVLKKKVRKRVVDFDTGSDTDERSRMVPSNRPTSNFPAFTGTVVEKPASTTKQPPMCSQTVVNKPVTHVLGQSSVPGAPLTEQSDNTKPVSRFKARRQNKTES